MISILELYLPEALHIGTTGQFRINGMFNSEWVVKINKNNNRIDKKY